MWRLVKHDAVRPLTLFEHEKVSCKQVSLWVSQNCAESGVPTYSIKGHTIFHMQTQRWCVQQGGVLYAVRLVGSWDRPLGDKRDITCAMIRETDTVHNNHSVHVSWKMPVSSVPEGGRRHHNDSTGLKIPHFSPGYCSEAKRELLYSLLFSLMR